jgi:hypothetical protein
VFRSILSPIDQAVRSSQYKHPERSPDVSLSAFVKAERNAAKLRLVIRRKGSPALGRDTTLLLAALRGTTPELHGLIRTLLNLSGMRPEGITVVAEELGEQAVVWPRELQGETLRGNLVRDKHRWIATLISAADLRGLLGELLRKCAQHFPMDRRWSDAVELYDRYDQLLLGGKAAWLDP